MLVKLNRLNKENCGDLQVEVPLILQELRSEFRGVFEMAEGLPPPRSHEHWIILREGNNLVGVKPYSYPQSQKGLNRTLN